jgi:hypothetical protein
MDLRLAPIILSSAWLGLGILDGMERGVRSSTNTHTYARTGDHGRAGDYRRARDHRGARGHRDGSADGDAGTIEITHAIGYADLHRHTYAIGYTDGHTRAHVDSNAIAYHSRNCVTFADGDPLAHRYTSAEPDADAGTEQDTSSDFDHNANTRN